MGVDTRYMGPDGVVYPSKDVFYEQFGAVAVDPVKEGVTQKIPNSLTHCKTLLGEIENCLAGSHARLATLVADLGGPFESSGISLSDDLGEGQIGDIRKAIDRLTVIAAEIDWTVRRLEIIA